MRPSSVTVFEHAISRPRLDSYQRYFRTRNLTEAIGLYQWNAELSACFSTLLAFLEITLRNNVHRTMSLFHSHGTRVSDHWYDRIRSSLKPSLAAKIDDVRLAGPPHARRPRCPAPSPDEIISRVSFGFWAGVLSCIDRRYADQLLPGIFPHHPLNARSADWAGNANRKQALAFIHEVNAFRNRMAHHEPLWKFGAIKDTSSCPAVMVIPASRHLADSLARFHRLLRQFDATMEALNREFHIDLLRSGWRRRLDGLLTLRAVARYRDFRHCPGGRALSPARLCRAFRRIVVADQPVRLYRARAQRVFIPG